jgi:hypothetical protein
LAKVLATGFAEAPVDDDLDLERPWFVERSGGQTIVRDEEGLIATIHPDVEDVEETARLIAAAPDLRDEAAGLITAMASLNARDPDVQPSDIDFADPALADMPEAELIELVNVRLRRLLLAFMRAESADEHRG